MLTEKPPITVLLPVFNAERYVGEAVRSILAQTCRRFEFLIIDDGSRDGSLAVLRDCARRDDRIRLISRPNRGLVATLNEGVELARGELIARMDADDIAMPERLERQAAYMAAYPACLALGSGVAWCDPDGEVLLESRPPLTHEEIDYGHLHGRGHCLVHPTLLVRRSALIAVGGYRAELWPVEDVDLFLRLAEHGRLANLPDILLKYRQHFASIGSQYTERQRELATTVIEDAYRRRGIQAVIPQPEVEGKRRPSEQHRMWAWWALRSGHVATARKHAVAALKREPFSVHSWRVLACSLRGH